MTTDHTERLPARNWWVPFPDDTAVPVDAELIAREIDRIGPNRVVGLVVTQSGADRAPAETVHRSLVLAAQQLRGADFRLVRVPASQPDPQPPRRPRWRPTLNRRK